MKSSVSAVIKLGGSLLDLPDLSHRVDGLLDGLDRPHPIMLCGGGPSVDVIRKWDRLHGLGEEASHWISLEALVISALVAERIMARLELVTSPDGFASVWERGKVPLYDALSFIRGIDEQTSDPLPRRWSVTSDSIAARMATTFGASEVVLLKSVSIAAGTTITTAAEQGLVDPYFPTAAAAVDRVSAVDLRTDRFVETTLLR